METEELRAALEALPVDERKKIAAAVLSGTADRERKAEHAREIGKLGGRPKGSELSQAHKDAIAAAQRKIGEERRARKQAEQPAQEKRRPGRPAKQEITPATAARPVGRPAKPKPEATEPIRGRGRPRKADTVHNTQATAEAALINA